MSMITATTWVPRGYAAPFPTKYDLDDEELARITKLTKLKLEDAKEKVDKATLDTVVDGNGSTGNVDAVDLSRSEE